MLLVQVTRLAIIYKFGLGSSNISPKTGKIWNKVTPAWGMFQRHLWALKSKSSKMLVFIKFTAFNSLWPSDAIWQHRFWSTLAQVITRCVMHQAIDLSHICGCPWAACRKPAGTYDKTTRAAICFWTYNAIYFNLCSIYTHLWYFGTSVTYPQWFRRVKLVVTPPHFV